MSSIAKIRALLSETSTLYDRFINIAFKSTAHSLITPYEIMTPMSGAKPDITVRLQILPGDITAGFSVLIKNLSILADLSKYNYCKISIGYYSSLSSYSFVGEIKDVSMLTPNPNGIFQITGVIGNESDLSWSNEITIKFNTDTITVKDLVMNTYWLLSGAYKIFANNSTISVNYIPRGNALISSTADLNYFLEDKIPLAWQSQLVTVNKCTEHFDNIYQLLAYVNSQLLYIYYRSPTSAKIGLPPIQVFINSIDGHNVLDIRGMFDSAPLSTILPILSKVNNISVNGDAITVTAPFVPTIHGKCIFYLYTGGGYNSVLNALSGGNIGVLSPVILVQTNTVDIDFSTVGNNSMTIQGIVIKDKIIQGFLPNGVY